MCLYDAGPVLECKWRGAEAKECSSEGKRPQSAPVPSDAEQAAMDGGRQWHSWHLNRLELPAWQAAYDGQPACNGSKGGHDKPASQARQPACIPIHATVKADKQCWLRSN